MSVKRRFFLINVFYAIIAFFYGRIVAMRNKLYDLRIYKSHQFKTHTIVVGNLAVGGTGKTPHIEYLIRLLSGEFDVTVLSRGYKRRFSGYIVAQEHHTTMVLGDEPRQMMLKFPQIKLAVDEKRAHGIAQLEKEFKGEKRPIILLDDAFQHRAVFAGFNIVLIDINNLPQKDYYLPLGTLRDNPKQIKRANIIIFTKVEQDLKPMEKRIFIDNLGLLTYQKAYFTKIVYKNLIPLYPREKIFDIKQLDPTFSLLLVTGIAKSKPLYVFLNEKVGQIIHLEYPDHHFYSQADMSKIIYTFDQISTAKKLIVTTEKDAVRLKEGGFAGQIKKLPIYYLPIEVDFVGEGEKEKFNEQILKYVRANKSIG